MFTVKESGRTTSALTEEDSSFYLWKWFVKCRRYGRLMRHKRRKHRWRRSDLEDDGFFYPGAMTRKVNGAYTHASTGAQPSRSISETYDRYLTKYLFPGENLHILQQLFPKLRTIKHGKHILKKRFRFDWTLNMSELPCSCTTTV